MSSQSSGAGWKSRWPSWAPRAVDVKQHWTMLTHWSQFVPNTSTRHPRTLNSTSSSNEWSWSRKMINQFWFATQRFRLRLCCRCQIPMSWIAFNPVKMNSERKLVNAYQVIQLNCHCVPALQALSLGSVMNNNKTKRAVYKRFPSYTLSSV